MTRPVLALTLAALLSPATASASLITDPVGDFVPTFLGPRNGDLDVLSAEVTYTGTNFLLHATLNAPVGTTPGGFYVWGFDRGAGTQGFPTIAPGVRFDRVVVLNSNGTTNVPGGSVAISGNEIFGVVPASFLPSTGFAPENFTWNLWPRSPVIAGNPLGNLSDFAPDNSNAAVTVAVPEPATVFALGAVAGVLALRLRPRAGKRC
jgi:hypothetical protein